MDEVGIGEAITHSQDGANTLQENIPAFDRQHASRVRDNSQLAVSQTNHAAHTCRSGDVKYERSRYLRPLSGPRHIRKTGVKIRPLMIFRVLQLSLRGHILRLLEHINAERYSNQNRNQYTAQKRFAS